MDYTKLRDGMVFHSHADDPVGTVIQWAVTWGKPKKDTPNHSGFIVQWLGQWMAAEVDGSHFRLNSLEKYAGKRNRIVAVYDPKIVLGERVALCTAIVRKVRKDFDKPYDAIGAIASAPWFKRWMPWMKQDPKKEFCSEVVYQLLYATTALTFPIDWAGKPPNPLALSDWQAAHNTQYDKVAI